MNLPRLDWLDVDQLSAAATLILGVLAAWLSVTPLSSESQARGNGWRRFIISMMIIIGAPMAFIHLSKAFRPTQSVAKSDVEPEPKPRVEAQRQELPPDHLPTPQPAISSESLSVPKAIAVELIPSPPVTKVPENVTGQLEIKKKPDPAEKQNSPSRQKVSKQKVYYGVRFENHANHEVSYTVNTPQGRKHFTIATSGTRTHWQTTPILIKCSNGEYSPECASFSHAPSEADLLRAPLHYFNVNGRGQILLVSE